MVEFWGLQPQAPSPFQSLATRRWERRFFVNSGKMLRCIPAIVLTLECPHLSVIPLVATTTTARHGHALRSGGHPGTCQENGVTLWWTMQNGRCRVDLLYRLLYKLIDYPKSTLQAV